MEAASQEEVGAWLADRQYFVVEISPAPFAAIVMPSEGRLNISSGEMNYFLLQLSNLINAGCPLPASLQALHRQARPGSLKILLGSLKDKIESGKSFSEALKSHPAVFSNLFITMVEVGEVGGMLDEILERYARLFDTMIRIKSKIVRAMIYPAVLMFMSFVVSWALLVYVFPVFIEQIETGGQVLPMPTQIVLGISNLLVGNTLWILLILVMIYLLFQLISRTESGGRFIGKFVLEMPVMSSLVRHIELALFSRLLGTLLKCGVPILTSLSAVEKAQRNLLFKEATKEIKNGVARGESLSSGMARYSDLFPDSLILMADVGERSGNIGEMLEKAGVIYERDLENAIETSVTMIQPVLVIFLSFFVFLLSLAMYLPLFDIIKVVR